MLYQIFFLSPSRLATYQHLCGSRKCTNSFAQSTGLRHTVTGPGADLVRGRSVSSCAVQVHKIKRVDKLLALAGLGSTEHSVALRALPRQGKMIGNAGDAKGIEGNRWTDDGILLIVLHFCETSAVLFEPLQGGIIKLLPLDVLQRFIKFKVFYEKGGSEREPR